MARGTTAGWAGRREFPSQGMGAVISTRTGGLSPTPSLPLGWERGEGSGASTGNCAPMSQAATSHQRYFYQLLFTGKFSNDWVVGKTQTLPFKAKPALL